MSDIKREDLDAYLDDALSETDIARVEQALRDSETLRRTLRALIQERDRGEHSIGAIWRREKLSCPTREQLGSYLLQVLDAGLQNYIDFHLHTIACPYCLANLADLQALQREPEAQVEKRRQRFFESSAGHLHPGKDTRK
jgi:hypothetical protein